MLRNPKSKYGLKARATPSNGKRACGGTEEDSECTASTTPLNSTADFLTDLGSIWETKPELKDRMGRGEKISSGVTEPGAQGTAKMDKRASTDISGEVCLMSENPYKALKLATKGRVRELEKLYNNDKGKFNMADSRGRKALHYAAINGQVAALDFILSTGSDIAEKDNSGNTALHLAVENDNLEVVEHLLQHGAPTDALNDIRRAPIHVMVDKDKPRMLEVFIKHESVDINLGDDDGASALHYAAWRDHPECAKVLLEAGAAMCIPCRIGLYPLHVAAQNASSKTLQTMLQYAEKAGYKREDILKFVNQEKFTPLHAAIASGEETAVQICIESGAQIDVSQEDGCNAIHLAAAQGATTMIQLMFELQPAKQAQCIRTKDKLDMTPLHKAALFDREECAAYLLKQGALIDELCEGGYSPMLLAASKSAWRTLAVLLKNGSDLTMKDNCDRNILHLIIKNGGKPSQFKLCMCTQKFRQLLDEKDKVGCTPLHYASKEGQLDTIESLLQSGAVLNAKNNNKQSPLHFAARYGRYNTCRRLLASSTGHVIVNETDENGMTPIHVAALNGHIKVVKMLLHNGAGLYRDINGNTPLHLSATNGYTQTMTALVNVHPHLIESQNKVGDTALHVAARENQANAVNLLLSLGAKMTKNAKHAHFMDEAISSQNRDVCITVVSHERWREVLDTCSCVHGCPVLGLIKYMPDVCQMVLDRCRIPSASDHKAKDFHYTYDFNFLQLSMDQVRQIKEKKEEFMPMLALNTMVKFNRENCLSHPVCLQFLKMKWSAYGMWFHLVNLVMYMTFLASLTVFVASYDGTMGHIDRPNITNHSFNGDPDKDTVKLDRSQHFLIYFILCFCILNAIKEVLQIIQQKWRYFLDFNNALEWVLYITSGIFIGPFIVQVSSNAQWECGAISVFLAWFNLLLFLQRFDFFGIYVVMFLEILKTLVQVIIVFSVLIIAFGFSFYILLNDVAETSIYHNPGVSLMTTIVMMLGNIDYADNWVTPMFNGTAYHVALRSLMLIVFVLLMPILLINLLIGLAVGDIEAVQRNARLKRLAMQVELHTDIEKKLPQKILEKVDRPNWKVYPNSSCSRMDRIWSAFGQNSMSETSVVDGVGSSDIDHQTFLYQELFKQKNRIKTISSDLAKQYELLKLVVQKMEIRTEADEIDEGEDLSNKRSAFATGNQKSIGWSSPRLRSDLIKQSSVVNKWKNISSKDN